MVSRGLIEDMTGWVKNAVPVLCQFVTCLQESGRIRDAGGIVAALTGAEPAFRKAVTNPEKFRKLSRRLFAQALDAGVSPDDRSGIMDFLMREVILMMRLDPENTVVRRELADLVQGRIHLRTAEEMRVDRILLFCEEFCSRLVNDLAAHPAAPLMRGDAVLWSATVVYAASQDAGLFPEAASTSFSSSQMTTAPSSTGFLHISRTSPILESASISSPTPSARWTTRSPAGHRRPASCSSPGE